MIKVKSSKTVKLAHGEMMVVTTKFKLEEGQAAVVAASREMRQQGIMVMHQWVLDGTYVNVHLLNMSGEEQLVVEGLTVAYIKII